MPRSLAVPGKQRGPQVKDLTAIGQMVRHRRLTLALRIDDAARTCGVAANVLSRLENGGTVGADRLLRVLSGLGLAMLVVTKEDALQGAPFS
jgi:transcriptional regulator with XRE-family HTH domain